MDSATSHRSSWLKQSNKPHKSWKKTKGELEKRTRGRTSHKGKVVKNKNNVNSSSASSSCSFSTVANVSKKAKRHQKALESRREKRIGLMTARRQGGSVAIGTEGRGAPRAISLIGLSEHALPSDTMKVLWKMRDNGSVSSGSSSTSSSSASAGASAGAGSGQFSNAPSTGSISFAPPPLPFPDSSSSSSSSSNLYTKNGPLNIGTTHSELDSNSEFFVPGNTITAVYPSEKFRASITLLDRTMLSALDGTKAADVVAFVFSVRRALNKESESQGSKMDVDTANVGDDGDDDDDDAASVKSKGTAASNTSRSSTLTKGGQKLGEILERSVDETGRNIIAMLKAQGLPSVIGVIQGLESVSSKLRSSVKKQAADFFMEEFGTHVKVVEEPHDKLNESQLKAARYHFLRALIDVRPRPIHWRSERSYMMNSYAAFLPYRNDGQRDQETMEAISESKGIAASASNTPGLSDNNDKNNCENKSKGKGSLVVRGYLRGRPLDIHQTIHVVGSGNFQIGRATRVPDPYPLTPTARRKKNGSNNASIGGDEGEKEGDMHASRFPSTILPDPRQLNPLEEEAEPDLLAGEQTWPTEEELAEADANANVNGKASIPNSADVDMSIGHLNELSVPIADYTSNIGIRSAAINQGAGIYATPPTPISTSPKHVSTELAATEKLQEKSNTKSGKSKRSLLQQNKEADSHMAAWLEGIYDDDDDDDDESEEESDDLDNENENMDTGEKGGQKCKSGTRKKNPQERAVSASASAAAGEEEEEEEEKGEVGEEENEHTRAAAFEAYKKRRKAAKLDAEFPDEVDTPLDIPARIRFQKFRGLKSFRKDEWHPKESLPREYSKIYELQNFQAVSKAVLKQAEELEHVWMHDELESMKHQEQNEKKKKKKKKQQQQQQQQNQNNNKNDPKQEQEGQQERHLSAVSATTSMMDVETDDGSFSISTDMQQEEEQSEMDEIRGLMRRRCLFPGEYVELVLENVPVDSDVAIRLSQSQVLPGMSRMVVLGALLAHENKLSVVHARVQMPPTCDDSIVVRSRDRLVMQCGFWRREVRPVFSEDNMNSDKHRFQRFLQRGQWGVASAYAPITFGTNIPVLLFSDSTGVELVSQSPSPTSPSPEHSEEDVHLNPNLNLNRVINYGFDMLVASGALYTVNPDRIVLKKVVISGHPLRVKKKWATVRFMFFNREDVIWFKPLDLWTKHGAAGRITDAVGTHGNFKCRFDRPIAQHDTVCMSLYKRVFPKPVNELQFD